MALVPYLVDYSAPLHLVERVHKVHLNSSILNSVRCARSACTERLDPTLRAHSELPWKQRDAPLVLYKEVSKNSTTVYIVPRTGR